MEVRTSGPRKIAGKDKKAARREFENKFPRWRKKGAGCYGRSKMVGVTYYPATQLMHFCGLTFWTDDPEAVFQELKELTKPELRVWMAQQKVCA